MKISYRRWSLTQENEQKAWESKKVDSENLAEAHRQLWQGYLKFIQEHVQIKQSDRILDIGCGPWGLINYINMGDRYGFDPLMDYFLEEFDMPKDIKFLKGVAEEIPFKNNFFDLVMVTNVLDHARQPLRILNEVKRVLKPNGILVLSIDCNGPLYKF